MNLKWMFLVVHLSGWNMVISETKSHPKFSTYRYNFLRDLHLNGDYNLKKEHMKANNLEGITLKVGLIEEDRYKYDCVEGASERRKNSFKKSYSFYLLNLLKDILKFEVHFVSVEKTTYIEDELALTGDNFTDVILCHWTTTGMMPKSIGFLLPTLSTTESFVYQPRNLPLTQDVFVETFSRRLWVFFLLSVFLVIVFFRISTSVHSSVKPDREPWTWDEVVLWAVAAISQQSFSKHPRGSSCRTTFLIGYTIAYLLYTGFAAGITSLLALQGHRDQLNFKNAADMNLHLLYNVHEYYFNDPIEGTGSIFTYDHFFHNAQPGNLSEIFSQIEKQNFVGIGSTPSLLSYLEKKIEYSKRKIISIVPVLHSSRQKALLVRKTFLYKEIFNYWLLRLMETGLLNLGQKRLISFRLAAGPSSKWLSADLGNVFSAILFLLGGWVLSVLILFFEIFWVKKRKSKTICGRKKIPQKFCTAK